jgi:hypothetical protein
MTNLICRLSGHKYSPLTYSQSSSKCVSERVCVRCGEKATHEQDHDWGQWRENEMMDCEKRALWRECQRCGRIETKNLGHDWGSWQREGAKPCTEMRTCSRCEAKEYKQTHISGEKRVGTCEIVKYCRICGKTLSTKYEHSFVATREEVDSNGWIRGIDRECIDCGETDYLKNPHYR